MSFGTSSGQKFRVAFVTSYFLPHSVGGGETHTFHLAQALQSRGHSVEVWLTSPTSEFEYSYEGLRVVPSVADSDENDVASALTWLREEAERSAIDLVHATISGNSSVLLEACVEMGMPIVVTLLDFHYWCPRALVKPSDELCSGPVSLDDCLECVLSPYTNLRRLLPIWRHLPPPFQKGLLLSPLGANLEPIQHFESELTGARESFARVLAPNVSFVAPSPIMRRLAEQHSVPPEKIMDLPYGVPDSLIMTRSKKSSSPLLRVGFIGRLARIKGIEVIIEAIRNLGPDAKCRLAIYGKVAPEEAEYEKTLMNLAADDPKVEFCGSIGQEELASVHAELDLMAIPSLWQENATIVLLESMALGTPVLASEVEGIAPLVSEGVTGFLVPAGDARGLSKQLEWCIDNLEAVRAMSDRCRAPLSMSSYATRIEALYRSTLGEIRDR